MQQFSAALELKDMSSPPRGKVSGEGYFPFFTRWANGQIAHLVWEGFAICSQNARLARSSNRVARQLVPAPSAS